MKSPASIVAEAKASVAEASVMRRPVGPVVTRAMTALLRLEQRRLISPSVTAAAMDDIVRSLPSLIGTTARKKSFTQLRAIVPPNERDSILAAALEARLSAAARLELARALHHLARARAKKKGTKVGHMSFHQYGRVSGDIPSEMSEWSDGVSDDGATSAEIIGCGPDCADIGDELSELTIGGLPDYLFTRRNLSNPVIRRRLAQNIEAMTPKLRRRVLSRLKLAVRQTERVSGEVRDAYPSIAGSSVAGYSGGYATVGASGWSGVSVGRCPLSSVAGRFTP